MWNNELHNAIHRDWQINVGVQNNHAQRLGHIYENWMSNL